MNILIFHRIPYYKINYHLSIDHAVHNVTYLGLARHLDNLPQHIRRKAITRPGVQSLVTEAMDAIHMHDVRPDLLIAMSDTDQMDAANVRERLGIAGARSSDVQRLRDRDQIRRAIAEHGIRLPRRATLSKVVREQFTRWEGRTVLMPADQSPSADVRIFGCPEELLYAVKIRKTGIARIDNDQAAFDEFEAEELIDGKIMHFDGLLSEGKIAVMLGSVYVGDCLSYLTGQPLGSVQVDLSGAERQWVQNVLDVIGVKHGVFHMEAVSSDNGRVFLDFANQAGGASVVETFRMATGVNLVTAALTAQLGEQIVVKARKKPKKFGWFVFPAHHLPEGRWRISGHTGYIDHPMMIRCDMQNKTTRLSRRVTFKPTALPLSGIVGGSSTDEMVSWIRKMFNEVSIKPMLN